MAILSTKKQMFMMSHTVENTYGDLYEDTLAKFVTLPYDLDGVFFEDAPNMQVSDDNQAHAGFGMTSHTVVNKILTSPDLVIPMDLTPTAAGLAFGSMADSDSSSAGGGGTTISVFNFTRTGLPTLLGRTLVANHFGAIRDFKGVVINGIEISASRSDPFARCNLIVNGYNAAQVSSFTQANMEAQMVWGNPDATTVTDSKFTFRNIAFEVGTWTSGGGFVSSEDLSTKLKSLTFNLNYPIDENAKYTAGATTIVPQQMLAVDKVMTLTASFDINVLGDAFHDEMIAETELAVRIQFSATNRLVEILLTRTRISVTPAGGENNLAMRSPEFVIMGDVTEDMLAVMQVQNLVADYREAIVNP